MNTLDNIIYTSCFNEYQVGIQGGQIDFTDCPVPSSIVPSLTGSGFYVTAPEYDRAYFELQFNMANQLWGVNQNFSNSLAGIQVRQGLAHLVNRVVLVNQQVSLQAQSSAIDNPIPPSSDLVLPSTCGWDNNYPESGVGCAAGAGHGGSSYNCSFAVPACPTGPLGAAAPYAWGAQIGSGDFCAAATHFINGFNAAFPGLAPFTKGANCVLTLTAAQITAVTTPIAPSANTLCTSVGLPQSAVCLYVRSDNSGRQFYGQALQAEICALFTGSYTVYPSQCNPYLTVREGGIGPAVCTIFSTTGCAAANPAGDPLNEKWGIYTGGFGDVFPQDAPYFLYNSQFVDKQTLPGPCASTTPFVFPGNYMYVCIPAEDRATYCMEIAPSFDIANDTYSSNLPVPCNKPAIGNSAGAWGNQTETIHGTHVATIPLWTGLNQFVTKGNNGWQRFVTDQGNGLPNFNTWLNAYSATPSTPGTIRQGFMTSPDTVNPYQASSLMDFYLLGDVYDSLSFQNPLNHNQLVDWLTSSSQKLASVPSYAPAGTTVTYRFNLRNGVFFQNGQKLTSWDVLYSLKSFWDYGAFQSGGEFPILGITVLSPFTFDMHLSYDGPFLRFGLTGNTILPANLWSAFPGNFTSTGLVGQCLSNPTQAGCLDATYQVDSSFTSSTGQCYTGTETTPSACKVGAGNMEVNVAAGFDLADPLTNGKFIGTGPFVCESAAGNFATLGGGCNNNGCLGCGNFVTLTKYDQATAGTSHEYFRSSNSLARYIWTANIGASQDSLTQSTVASCIGNPVGTAGCTHWQNGIGSNTPGTPTLVASGQWSLVTLSTGIPWMHVVVTNAAFGWGELSTGGIAILGIGTAPSGYNPAAGAYTPTKGPTLYGSSYPQPCALDSVFGYDC